MLQGVLRALIDGGARLAQCGEFSKRAFVNGKLTLPRLEGMIESYKPRTERSFRRLPR